MAVGFRVRTEKCASCLFVLRYEKTTRDRIMAEVSQVGREGYIQCHQHDPASGVCCRGFWDAFPEHGAAMQVARRLTAIGIPAIEWVEPGGYPHGEEEDDDLG